MNLKDLTKEEIEELKDIDNQIGLLSLSTDNYLENIKKSESLIKKHKKRILLMLKRIEHIDRKRHDLLLRFSDVEKDMTCYGCCNEKCTVSHDTFSLRCSLYNELPF